MEQPSNQTKARFVGEQVEVGDDVQSDYVFRRELDISASESQEGYLWECAELILHLNRCEGSRLVNQPLSNFRRAYSDFPTVLELLKIRKHFSQINTKQSDGEEVHVAIARESIDLETIKRFSRVAPYKKDVVELLRRQVLLA